MSNATMRPRHPAGSPVGGRFSAGRHDAATDVQLSDDWDADDEIDELEELYRAPAPVMCPRCSGAISDDHDHLVLKTPRKSGQAELVCCACSGVACTSTPA